MSLINDALKQARKAPPENTPATPPMLQPVAKESPRTAMWLLPAVVILLVVAAVFFIGWSVARHTSQTIAVAPPPMATPVATVPKPAVVPAPVPNVPIAAPAPQQVAVISPPAIQPQPVNTPTNPPPAPKLQGIFYSPTAPSAIVDGKTVHPGDRLHQYRVKMISQSVVTLIGPDQKEIQISMDN